MSYLPLHFKLNSFVFVFLFEQLTDAVGLTLKRDARRRTRWLLFAFLGELVLLLAIFGCVQKAHSFFL